MSQEKDFQDVHFVRPSEQFAQDDAEKRRLIRAFANPHIDKPLDRPALSVDERLSRLEQSVADILKKLGEHK